MKHLHYRRSVVSCLLLAVAALGLIVLPGRAFATLTAKANHDHITIDSFYHGSSVSVRGVCDSDAELIIKITSPEGHMALKEKGKAGGLLWMNVAELRFGNTPNLYLINGSKKIEDLVAVEEADKYVLGYSALKRHITMEPISDPAERVTWSDEFIKYKENQNLYLEGNGKITFSAKKDGSTSYYLLFDWPYQAAPGDYLVDVYAIKDCKVVETAQSKINVEQVGTVKYLATMAKENGGMYGALSIVVAIFCGFGVGMIFRKGGGAH